ncbi:hypothetical protein AJ79_10160 [Helicocarpus griseus UAMH5409]|uniref:Enoyl reductase (ER) domain-containing protein n=1 Tax=Helicocarpus griseus UAMH5409 TaxID=1447875 RepID=A0A2B7WFL0_9EURO|nr:hypothetical protein AJ79_10160 [Helicocarpus griseus UAMH5409]
MASQAPELPFTMKAQELHAYNTPYILRDVPIPKIMSPYDLLIKIDAASYCHTDAVVTAGQKPGCPSKFPHVGCHEFAGTVIAKHAGAAPCARTFQPGDRVGVVGCAYHPCEECDECLSYGGPESDSDPPGYSVYCPHAGNLGITLDGGFQEYAVVDARQVAVIPTGMSAAEAAPLMCAGVTIYAALKKLGLERGQGIGIIGCGGGLGHLGLQFAVKMGLDVIGVDNADRPLQLARELNTGARIVDARSEEAADIAQGVNSTKGGKPRPSGERGLDAVIVLPESQRAFDYGVKLLRNHGKCMVISVPTEGFRFSAADVVLRDISIIGSLVGSNRVTKEMLEFAARHQVKSVSRSFPLTGLNDLVREYEKGLGGKLVIDMSLR